VERNTKVAVAEALRDNVDILRDFAYTEALPKPEVIEQDAHNIRVKQALGIRVAFNHTTRPMRDKVLQALAKAHMVWKVDKRFVLGIRYVAAVKTPDMVTYTRYYRSVTSFKYVGDIPDFALDNMEKAKKAGIKHFTIHSNLPLPVKRAEKMLKSDPIMIGWTENPTIKVDATGSIKRMSRNIEGVVIAVWDGDKETAL
jgi:hypothetical protein